MTSGGRLVVLVGHPKPHSRTHGVAAQAGRLLQRALGAERIELPDPTVVDLADIAPQLVDRRGRNGVADAAMRTVCGATVLVAASPTFRASYAGLLKYFLDLLPRDGLETTVAVPVMTAGLPSHRWAVDTTLRPVLLELRALVPTPGIAVLETELSRVEALFASWWGEHGPALADAVRSGSGRLREDVGSC
jgi:FMN reductase